RGPGRSPGSGTAPVDDPSHGRCTRYGAPQVPFLGGIMMHVWPGKPSPLGATWDGKGVNFALFSAHATRVELCLFATIAADQETHRISFPAQTEQIWHAYLPEARPGQLYGYRVYGPYAPQQGHRFNPNKLVLDPYARAIGREGRWGDALFGYRVGARDA